MSFLKEKAGEGPGMVVSLAVKLQHDLHVDSKSDPSINVCAGVSVGCQLSPLGYSHILSGPEDSSLLATGAAAPWPPQGCNHVFSSAMAEQHSCWVCNLAQDCYETQSHSKAKAK